MADNVVIVKQGRAAIMGSITQFINKIIGLLKDTDIDILDLKKTLEQLNEIRS